MRRSNPAQSRTAPSTRSVPVPSDNSGPPHHGPHVLEEHPALVLGRTAGLTPGRLPRRALSRPGPRSG
jgi:hypothetical protein